MKALASHWPVTEAKYQPTARCLSLAGDFAEVQSEKRLAPIAVP